MKLNGKQYDKFILNGKTYDKFYLNNKIYQSLDPGLILDLPLSSNLLDLSPHLNHATMVGTETHSLGGLQTSTGNYAYISNKTSLDFGTGSLRLGGTVKFNSVSGTFGIFQRVTIH